MYQFLEFLHIFGAVIFFLGHGATAIGMFNMRNEKSPEGLRALMGLRKTQMALFFVGFLLMGIPGIWLGFLGRYWGTGWLWGSIVIFLVILGLMGYYGRGYFDAVEIALDPNGEAAKRAKKPETRSLEEVVASGRVWMLAWTGIGGTAIILYLMMYKPF